MKQNRKVRDLAVRALFVALIFVLGMTPLGMLNLPFVSITTLHIPVIIGAVVFGVQSGALLGFSFGIVSLIRCFTTPDTIAAIVLGTGSEDGFALRNFFMVVLVLIVPRVLVGVVAALLSKGLRRFDGSMTWSTSVASVAASLTNSVLVLGILLLMAFSEVSGVLGETGAGAVTLALFGGSLLNIVFEAIFAAVLCTAVCKALSAYIARHEGKKKEKTEPEE